jgi:hypothetical protein
MVVRGNNEWLQCEHCGYGTETPGDLFHIRELMENHMTSYNLSNITDEEATIYLHTEHADIRIVIHPKYLADLGLEDRRKLA